MKHFVNERSEIVTEALDLEVMLSGGQLARLDGYPAIKVIVRTDWNKSQVAVISGGGAGHEPAHAGFVGDGLLTAAVSGEIFASPTVDAVLAAILAVTGAAGCLLVVKNYTGDRLNFGLAAEKARALGFAVEMVIVADDIAIACAPHPRGLAGTLFVHKAAGHRARSGASLAEVKVAAEHVAGRLRSLGVSFASCTIPGQSAENRIGPEEVELGLGIHGEPGAERVPYRPMRELAATMAARIDTSLGNQKLPLALLINDLGGVPPIEMAVATHSLLAAFAALEREVALVFGPGRLMTSLDMKGLSVTALPLDAAIEPALLAAVAPAAWPMARRVGKVTPLAIPARVTPAAPVPSADPQRRRVVERLCTRWIALEAELNALDAKVGDGDTGSTFATAARAVVAELDGLPFAEPASLCAAIAARLGAVMGGSSGILLSIGIAAMGAAVGERHSGPAKTRDPGDWIRALRQGLARIEQYGGARQGDRTMLDALLPAAVALERGEGLAGAAAAARAGAELTATMTRARAGRSSLVPEDALRGVPDPGAIAMAEAFETLRACADDANGAKSA